jgi:UDP-N-acetylmuramate dehydrogenase
LSWRENFSDIIDENTPLKDLTTFKVGGHAKYFVRPRDAQELAQVYKALVDDETCFRILGGGANLLIDDGVHDTPILYLDRLNTRQENSDGEFVLGAGLPFLKLVNETVRNGWAGLEGLAGIPGHVGGICTMNAGGRWGEFKDVVTWVEVATPEGEVKMIPRENCGFAYRSSNLPGLVTAVGLKLERSVDAKETRAQLASFLKSKSGSQPLRASSAGCCFANPPGRSVGQMVEELGLKGERRGAAEISDIHGNFILNLGGARFDDVIALFELIEDRVQQAFGITLRREVQIWRRDPASQS